MARHLDKFAKPFRDSRIPFLLLEVLTDGQGAMVDLVCRFANGAAAALLDLTTGELQGKRLTRNFPTQSLNDLQPLAEVAFSGSSVSFSVTTMLGRTLDITVYQPMYGMAACILEPHDAAPATAASTESLPCPAAVVELSRAGVRCLSLNRNLCALAGQPRRLLLESTAGDFSALVVPADWPPLLQDLLDAARDRRSVERELRLHSCGGSRWVDLRAVFLSSREGVSTFCVLLLDIDRHHRDTARLEAQVQALELARSERDRLLDLLPGGHCLFHLADGAPPVPLLVTQGLAKLLGYPLSELKRRLAADLLWRVPAADREPLTTAALQARQAGVPLLHTCRMRPKTGAPLLVSLEAVWQPQREGGWLLYAVCTDVTAAQQAARELKARSRLCETLLDRSRLFLLDYDCTRDILRIQRYDADGRRAAWTEEHYAASLGDSAAIHPNDRKKLSAAFRRTAYPSAEPLEYRADYNGLGWRWYRLTLLAPLEQADGARLLGKAEDITARKAAEQRFHRLRDRQKKLVPPVLASARLDLSTDRILDAKGASGHLVRVLFGNTADACLRHLRNNIPSVAQQVRFDALFRRDTLLEAFRQGRTYFELEHRFTSGDGGTPWVRTTLELAEDPETLHAAAFCFVQDLSASCRKDGLLEALAARDYELILTVEAATGLCRSPAAPPSGGEHTWRETVTARLDRDAKLPDLTEVTTALDAAPVYDWPLSGASAALLRWSWLDKEAGTLLLTLAK